MFAPPRSCDSTELTPIAYVLRDVVKTALSAALVRRGLTAAAHFFRGSVGRPKLLQEFSRRKKVACLEAFGKSAEDRIKKFERLVSLGPISPESCEG